EAPEHEEAGDELPAAGSGRGRLRAIATDRPDDRSEDAAAVEWKPREHVERREIQVDRPEVARPGDDTVEGWRGADVDEPGDGLRYERDLAAADREPDDPDDQARYGSRRGHEELCLRGRRL